MHHPERTVSDGDFLDICLADGWLVIPVPKIVARFANFLVVVDVAAEVIRDGEKNAEVLRTEVVRLGDLGAGLGFGNEGLEHGGGEEETREGKMPFVRCHIKEVLGRS